MNTPHLVEASGDIATFSTDMIAPLKSCVVAINPVQAGTGDPSPDNVRPISGWSAVNVWRTGKNLWDDDFTPQIIEVYSVSGNKDTAYGKELHLPTGTYVFSFNGSPAAYIYGNVLNADGTWKSTFKLTTSIARVHTITLANGEYANLYLASGKVTELTSGKIQIELGSIATDYAPYTGTTYPITIPTPPGTVYGGYIQVGADGSAELVVDMAIHTFNGGPDEIWVKSSFAYYNSDIADYSKQSQSKLMANQYKSLGLISGRNALTADCTFGLYRGDLLYGLYIRDDQYESVEALRAGLSTTNLVICYELATPVTYQLTPQEISTLQGTNNLLADCGPVNIKYWTH